MGIRTFIQEGRYADALAIVDELEGMSKQAILRNIQAYLNILLIHLIKNQVEQRLTGSWANSIRNSIREIKKLNIKDNKISYYINLGEWQNLIEEEVIEDAMPAAGYANADASEEVMNGKFTRSQLSAMLDKSQILTTANSLLALTYTYSAKELPTIMDDYLSQLAGGEDWVNREK
ncbi:MAG: DUF29 family protein [Nostoc sp.]